MRDLRVRKTSCAMCSFINQKGERVEVPLVRIGREYRQVGTYLVYGTSRSDPAYAAVHALPAGWEPDARMLRAVERAR